MPDVHKPKAQKPQAKKPEPADVTCPACGKWTAEYVSECLLDLVWDYDNSNPNYEEYEKQFVKRMRILVKITNKYGAWFSKGHMWCGGKWGEEAVPCPCPLCKGTGRVIPDLCTAYVLAGGDGALTIKAMVALRKALSG